MFYPPWNHYAFECGYLARSRQVRNIRIFKDISVRINLTPSSALYCKEWKPRCCPPPGEWWATWVVSMATNYFTCPSAVSNKISISIITSVSIWIIVTIPLAVGNNISISIITSIDIRIIMTFSLAVSNNKCISISITNNQILLFVSVWNDQYIILQFGKSCPVYYISCISYNLGI